MGFNPPVPQRDSNWEIRVAVLLSLAFQVVLIFTAPLRKRSSSPLIRFVLWSCYLLADWVADLALGLLLNNMGNIGGGGSSSDMVAIPSTAAHGGVATTTSGSRSLGGPGGGGSPIIFAFWAPFLLLHLGGPDTITAYALADNELWLRHLIGLLFELSAAVVVFLCSLQGNPMVLPIVLMFIAGIIKYGERTYSLYTGSTDGFTAPIIGNPEIQSTDRLMQAYSSRVKAGFLVEMVTIGDREALWDVYGEAGKALSQVEYDGADEVRAYNLFVHFRSLFVHGTISTRYQRMSEVFYLVHGRRDPMEAFHIMELELSYMYDLLYTKMPVLSTTAGYVFRFVGCCCVVSSLVIFRAHDKAGLLPVDAGVTYALLFTAVALEAVALVMLLFSNWTVVFIHQSTHFKRISSWLVSSITKAKQCWSRWTWTGSETARGMNLIDHSMAMHIPASLRGFFLTPVANNAAASFIGKIQHLLDHTKIGKEEYRHLLAFIFDRIGDTVTKATTTKERKECCEVRGERAILRELKECIHLDESRRIESTVIFKSVRERDFDESLLLWHIATDLCLNADDRPTAATQETYKMRMVSRCLSEYMLYLLLNKPELMSATVRIGQLRNRNTLAGARLLMRSLMSSDIINHQSACHSVLSMGTSTFEDNFLQGDRTKTVLSNACILANALMKTIANQDDMWRVVAHVWMEILTFSAARTPAREHLRQLSDGGELITVVWFLMAHMGMSSSLFEVQDTDSLNKLIIIDQ